MNTRCGFFSLRYSIFLQSERPLKWFRLIFKEHDEFSVRDWHRTKNELRKRLQEFKKVIFVFMIIKLCYNFF